MGFVLESILLAVILIFLILASQFESFTQPFAIMLSLPLSLIGVLLALLLTDDTFNMMTHDRRDHADGVGDEERHSSGRQRQRATSSGARSARRRSSRPGACVCARS